MQVDISPFIGKNKFLLDDSVSTQNYEIHPGSLLPMGCPINESNNMAFQRRNTDGQTDVQTDLHFSRLKISELGENSFILILLIVKVWSSHVKIRV